MIKIVKKIIKRMSFLCLTLFFISCENFLDSDGLADDIKESIAYNNAPSSTLVLNAPEGTGRFLSANEQTCKLGYTINIQFSVNSNDYFYKGMQAVSKSKPSESMSKYVKFTDLTTEEDKQFGTYKVQVKLLKLSDDIMIQPKCILIPKIIDAWPPNDNTSYPQDTSIKITFNKQVKLSDFSDSTGFLKNISIQSGDKDLLNTENPVGPYYKFPCLENNGKTLVIPIAKNNHLFDNSTAQIMKINVTVNLSELTDDVAGENVSFQQDEYNFSFRINPQKDSVPPVLKKLNIARTKEDALNGVNLIAMDEFTHYADKINYNGDSSRVADNIQNHHVNKIWIYFEAEDADSGVAFLEIKEQLIYNNNGEKIEGAVIYDKNNCPDTNCFLNSTGNNSFSACVEYNFCSMDGIVRLDFALHDYAGQTKSCTNDFVKDTSCRLKINLEHSEIKFIEDCENTDYVPYNIILNPVVYPNNDYSSSSFARDMNGNLYEDTFVTKNVNNFTGTAQIINISYGYDKNNMILIDLRNAEYNVVDVFFVDTVIGKKKQYIAEIYANPYKTLYIEAIAEDCAGNINKSSITVPPVPDTVGVEITKISDILKLQCITTRQPGNGLIRNCDVNYMSEPYSNSLLTISKGHYNVLPETFYVSFCSKSDNFITYYGKSIKLKKVQIDTVNTFEQLTEEDGASPPTENDIPPFTVNVENPINGKNKFVQVNFNSEFTFNSNYYYLIYCDDKIQSGNAFELPYRNDPVKLTIRVYDKNGNYVESTPYEIDCSYDNIAPIVNEFKIKKILHGKCIAQVIITDEWSQGSYFGGSGIKEIKYFFSENKIDTAIDWENDGNIRTPYSLYNNCYEFNYSANTPNYIDIYAKDNNGNYTEMIRPLYIQRTAFSLNVKGEGGIIKESAIKKCSPIHEYIYYDNWEVIEEAGEFGSIELTNNPVTGIYSSELQLKSAEKESFIRVIPSNSEYNPSIGEQLNIDSIFYYYPAYILAEETASPIECDLKDFYIGNAGINILADQPCFAHTLYFQYNLGNSPQVWIDNGFETGLVMKKKSFTYSYDNTNAVSSGYYYTTIIHFADGTMLMTPVQKK